MMRPLLLLLAAPPLAPAQSFYPRHNLTLGLGAMDPRADLTRPFRTSFGLNLGYGYRFHRLFQIDAGFETAFGAGRVRDFFFSPVFGDLRIRDYQFFVPLGGRAILPIRERVLIYGGGGGAYLRYTELLRQPGNFVRVDCPVCGSRHGVGSYATAGVNAYLDRYRRFRLGMGGKVYRGSTAGDRIGEAPSFRTRDHWITLSAEFGVSF